MDEAAIQDALAREQAAIARLDDERRGAHERIEALRAQLRALEQTPAHEQTLPAPAADMLSNNEKLALFRRLFRGREDVYPRRWESKATGKKGYSPVCSNLWKPGICDMKKVKCGECPNQAYTALTDHAVVDHIKGNHVIGVYPLLPDETCWFLAVDFDKHAWAEDVAAFRETCKALDVPVAVERSRSGNGAHAWFFFAAPIAAATARKMGCYLLTEAMTRRHQVKLDSYDRLFPNQDIMPKGGYGNLIALPLQGKARRDGNSVFIDEAMVPYPDQWAYLAAIEPLSPGRVEDLVERSRSGVTGTIDRDLLLGWTPARPWIPNVS